MTILLALHRIGPYHHARFQAAAELLTEPLHILETRPDSVEYPWQFDINTSNYSLSQLPFRANPEGDLSDRDLINHLVRLIDLLKPNVVVSVGWADRAYLRLLILAQERNIPVVVISDSRQCDQPRSFFKEFLKRQVLKGFSAAIVAGTQSCEYLCQLGLERAGIHQPWDVVDNQLIAQLAAEAASSAPPSDERPFLCVGRFIPEKNSSHISGSP